MANETMIYVANALGGTDDAGLYKASDFLGVEVHDSDEVMISFASQVDGRNIDTVRLTVTGGLTGTGTNKFRKACQVISGVLNNPKAGKMIVLADEVNGIYIDPIFSGAVLIDQS